MLKTAILGVLILNAYFFIYRPALAAFYLRGLVWQGEQGNYSAGFAFWQRLLKTGTYVADNSPRYVEGFYNGLLGSDLANKKEMGAVINGETARLLTKHSWRLPNYLIFARQLVKYGFYFPESRYNANLLAREVLRGRAVFLAPRRPQVYSLLAITSYGAGDYQAALSFINRAVELRPNIKLYAAQRELILRGIDKK